jgi:uncharacterized protein (DUF433 family)
MSRGTRSLAIPENVYAALAATARDTGRGLTDVAGEMLDEAIRMRRVPGIVFADSMSGRVARIAGTGLEVWEIVEEHRAVGGDWDRLKVGYHWLSDSQLQAALAYAAAYPDEIEAALHDNAAWTPERVWATHPATRPPSR